MEAVFQLLLYILLYYFVTSTYQFYNLKIHFLMQKKVNLDYSAQNKLEWGKSEAGRPVARLLQGTMC